jgi:hypothetical protein
MEGKHDVIFDEVVGAYRAKHLRDVMAFQKNWNNESIAQFFATLYVEESGDTKKFHLMTEGRRYDITFEQFARLFGFGWNDANHIKIHFASRLDASRVRFMYPGNKRESVETTSDLLPFYAYLNRLFQRMMTPREGDSSNIPSYNRNLLVAMNPHPHGFEFSMFHFIWGDIKTISESPLKSCGYALYIIHMIVRVTYRIFGYDKEYHPLRIKNDLRAPVEKRKAPAPRSSSLRAARGRGQQGDKPLSPIQKIFSLLFGMCKSQHTTDVRAQHERRERRKITKSVKEIHTHLNLQPLSSPIASDGEESPEIESFEERMAHFDEETLVQQWYDDVSFSGFGFDYGVMGGASSSHPPPFDSPPPANPQNVEESEEEDDDGDE